MKDYDSFYEAIDVRIPPQYIKSKEQLKNVMDAYGFFDGLRDPKSNWSLQKRDNTVSMAWDYLKTGAIRIEKQKGFVKEVIVKKKKHPVQSSYQTTIDIKYEGKEYKKGETVPKDIRYRGYKILNNRGQVVKQADVTIRINGKWYKKGQFLPSKFRVA